MSSLTLRVRISPALQCLSLGRVIDSPGKFLACCHSKRGAALILIDAEIRDSLEGSN